MLQSKRADTHDRHSDGGSLLPVVALLAAAAAIEYLLPGGERSRAPSSADRPATENGRARLTAADGDDRGRLATTPSEIPPRGWKDILLRVYSNVSKHRILALAAGMTYYSLLAIFPALAALVAVYGLFADPSAIAGTSIRSPAFCPAAPWMSRGSSSRASPPRGRRPSGSRS